MKKKYPLISCIIATYNRAGIVRDAIQSIINQSCEDWELIVVDDQSTDNTWEVITKYEKKDSRIHCFTNPNKGANHARNLGISEARGKYIAFLDDDDMSYPHRFESQSKAMIRSKSRFIVSCFDVRDRETGIIKRVVKKKLKGYGTGFPSRWMIEKTLLDEVGGFNPKMIAMQDIELSYRLAMKCIFAHHDDIVTTMYNTPDSTSTGNRAVRGKIQLLQEVGHLMHHSERSSWVLTIVEGLCRTGESKNMTKQYLRETLKNNPNRFHYGMAMIYINLQQFDNRLARKITSKLYSKFINLTFPRIVRHEIVE